MVSKAIRRKTQCDHLPACACATNHVKDLVWLLVWVGRVDLSHQGLQKLERGESSHASTVFISVSILAIPVHLDRFVPKQSTLKGVSFNPLLISSRFKTASGIDGLNAASFLILISLIVSLNALIPCATWPICLIGGF